MRTITVTKDISYPNPWVAQYRIDGWGNPAGEVYDLKNGQFLALVNSASTGYRRKVFKKSLAAYAWVQNKLREEFPNDQLNFTIAVPNILLNQSK